MIHKKQTPEPSNFIPECPLYNEPALRKQDWGSYCIQNCSPVTCLCMWSFDQSETELLWAIKIEEYYGSYVDFRVLSVDSGGADLIETCMIEEFRVVSESELIVAMAAEIVDAAAHQASPQALETISKYFTTALVQESFFEAAHDTLQELGFKRWDRYSFTQCTLIWWSLKSLMAFWAWLSGSRNLESKSCFQIHGLIDDWHACMVVCCDSDNTLVLVNSCRDELARPISHFFDKVSLIDYLPVLHFCYISLLWTLSSPEVSHCDSRWLRGHGIHELDRIFFLRIHFERTNTRIPIIIFNRHCNRFTILGKWKICFSSWMSPD